MKISEHIIKINIPDRLEKIAVIPLLLYRRLRYGYAFRRIPLTQGKYAIVDNDDYFRLNKYKWHTSRGRSTFYAVRDIRTGKNKQKEIIMHREIMKTDDEFYVDHINGNGLDNRKANLRAATALQNSWNCRKTRRKKSSKYKGVSWLKRQKIWQSRIQANGKMIFLGNFKDEKKAAEVYDQAAQKHHKEFAVLNSAMKTSILRPLRATEDGQRH